MMPTMLAAIRAPATLKFLSNRKNNPPVIASQISIFKLSGASVAAN